MVKERPFLGGLHYGHFSLSPAQEQMWAQKTFHGPRAVCSWLDEAPTM